MAAAQSKFGDWTWRVQKHGYERLAKNMSHTTKTVMPAAATRSSQSLSRPSFARNTMPEAASWWKKMLLKSTAHLLELRFACLDSNVSKIFHLSCAFLLSPEALTQKKMTPVWNVQVKISSVRLETETCYTDATHWVFMLCPMFAASVDGKGVTSVFARSTEFSPSEAHVREQIWHGKTQMQWEAFHVHPWSSFCLWIAAREQLKTFKTISPWSTLYPSISPNLYPSTHPSPSIYQPLIHPLYNLYPFTHPSPSIYQPLQPLIHPLSTLYPTFILLPTRHPASISPWSTLYPTFILLPTRHPASISPWSTLYPTFVQPFSNLYPSNHPSPSIYQPLIHPVSNLCPIFSNLYPNFILLPTRHPASISLLYSPYPPFIQPLSFYQPVTHHLSTLYPPFILPLSFYPPVTQHLSALDPTFIHPLSNYPPVAQHISLWSTLSPPFLHSLSFYPPVTQHLPALDPPSIQPSSNLFPTFILLTTRHPASISPLSFYPPVTQHRSAFDSPFIQPLSFYPPVTQHLSALDPPFIQPLSFYPPAPSIYQPLIHPLSFYPPVTQHLHQPAEARSSTCPLSGKLSCHAEPGICPPAWLPLWLAAYRLLETVAERRFGAFGTPRFLRVGNSTICPSWPSSVWLAGQLFRPAVSRDCEVSRRLSGAMHSAGCIALVGMAASPGTPRTARRQHKGLEASAPWQKRRLVFCSAGSRNEKGLRKEMGKLHCIATACCTMNYREMLKMVAKRSLRAQKQKFFQQPSEWWSEHWEQKQKRHFLSPFFLCLQLFRKGCQKLCSGVAVLVSQRRSLGFLLLPWLWFQRPDQLWLAAFLQVQR